MGKYSKKKKKQKKNVGLSILLTALLALLVLLIWVAILLARREVPVLEPGNAGTTQQESTGENTDESTDALQIQPQMTEPAALELSDGLRILSVSKYTGMYMEDGTNEIVSDVMMIVLENGSEKDLQLARISLEYSSMTAEFEVTNLPAGEKAVLLEKNRQPMRLEDPLSAQSRNVLFFPEKMQVREDRLQITGSNGSLKVTNVSGADITGDIYIYYKNSASDLLYGGITYRTSVKGGLAAGESASIIAGHYAPASCRILQVEIIE